MMNIVYCSLTDFPSNLANSVQQIKTAAAMARLGHKVQFYFKKTGQNWSDLSSILYYYDCKRNKNLKLEMIPVSDGKYIYKIYLVKLLTRFFTKKILRKSEVIFTREPRIVLMFSLIARIKGIKLIFESHDLSDIPYRCNYRTFMLTRYALKRADAVITVTNICKDEMVNLGIKNSKILVSPDAADLKRYSIPRQSMDITRDIVKIAYTGSLYQDRGPDILIKSLPYLANKIKFKVIIVGGSNEEIDRLKKMAVELGEGLKVQFVGQVKHRDVKKWIENADILVLPMVQSKVGDKYASPMKLFEYMASKRPIIASKLPTIQEILDEENSTLYSPNDPKALAQAVFNVTTNWQGAIYKAKNAYDKFIKNYTFTIRAKKIIDFIK